jgi:hypothetical protein
MCILLCLNCFLQFGKSMFIKFYGSFLFSFGILKILKSLSLLFKTISFIYNFNCFLNFTICKFNFIYCGFFFNISFAFISFCLFFNASNSLWFYWFFSLDSWFTFRFTFLLMIILCWNKIWMFFIFDTYFSLCFLENFTDRLWLWILRFLISWFS